jgi:hypothetical protein
VEEDEEEEGDDEEAVSMVRVIKRRVGRGKF